METQTGIPVKLSSHSNLGHVDWDHMEFGKYISDHMFRCQYKNGEWTQPEIVPFQNISLSPATLALHYGQSIFEGMKAFRRDDGSIVIFRMDKHYDRINKSLRRMCMPELPYDLFTHATTQLVATDRNWVPKADKGSYYIRPIIFASEARYGVKVADEYLFLIFGGPVGPYFAKPLRLKVERQFVRAAKGGTGSTKCAGNYGGAFYPTRQANEQGFDQILWTDSKQNEYIEESGMMNAMFVINGELVTPPLSDSILDGITRDSFLQLAEDMNIPHRARPISVTELKEAFQSGTITEAFGAGTAAVVAPIAIINIDGQDYKLPEYSGKSIMNQLKNKLNAIRRGIEKDVHGWNDVVEAGREA
jgi:branched-chain amino acid aminotransferase